MARARGVRVLPLVTFTTCLVALGAVAGSALIPADLGNAMIGTLGLSCLAGAWALARLGRRPRPRPGGVALVAAFTFVLAVLTMTVFGPMLVGYAGQPRDVTVTRVWTSTTGMGPAHYHASLIGPDGRPVSGELTLDNPGPLPGARMTVWQDPYGMADPQLDPATQDAPRSAAMLIILFAVTVLGCRFAARPTPPLGQSYRVRPHGVKGRGWKPPIPPGPIPVGPAPPAEAPGPPPVTDALPADTDGDVDPGDD